MSRSFVRVALAIASVAGALLAAGLFPAPSAAASSPALTLSVERRSHHPAQLTLVARLLGGPARAGKTVAFYVVSTEFKQPHNVPIGSAVLGAGGTARIAYTPTWSGSERFVAKLSGAHVRPATADYRVAVSTPGPLSTRSDPGRPLASVGGVFLRAILTVVALVWLGLIVVLVLAIVRIPRLAGGGTDWGGSKGGVP